MIAGSILNMLLLSMAAPLAQLRYEARSLLRQARSPALVIGADMRGDTGQSSQSRKGRPGATGGRWGALRFQLGPKLADVPSRHLRTIMQSISNAKRAEKAQLPRMLRLKKGAAGHEGRTRAVVALLSATVVSRT